MFIYSQKNVLLEMIEMYEEIYNMTSIVRITLVVCLSISLYFLLRSKNTKKHTVKHDSRTFRDLFTYDVEEDF